MSSSDTADGVKIPAQQRSVSIGACQVEGNDTRYWSKASNSWRENKKQGKDSTGREVEQAAGGDEGGSRTEVGEQECDAVGWRVVTTRIVYLRVCNMTKNAIGHA
jgi:hypothetical protein